MIIQTNQIIPHTAPALFKYSLLRCKYLRDDLRLGQFDAEYSTLRLASVAAVNTALRKFTYPLPANKRK